MSIKYWRDIWSESTLSSTLHFIYNKNFRHNNTHIVAWIHIITKYIEPIFWLNGPLYYTSIWIPSQSWSNYVMIECMPFLENLKYKLVIYNMAVWRRKIWILHLIAALCNHILKLSNTRRINKDTITSPGCDRWLNIFWSPYFGVKLVIDYDINLDTKDHVPYQPRSVE